MGNGIGTGLDHGADWAPGLPTENAGDRAAAILVEYRQMGNPLANMSKASELTGRAIEVIVELAQVNDALTTAVAGLAENYAQLHEHADRVTEYVDRELMNLRDAMRAQAELIEAQRGEIDWLTPFADEGADAYLEAE